MVDHTVTSITQAGLMRLRVQSPCRSTHGADARGGPTSGADPGNGNTFLRAWSLRRGTNYFNTKSGYRPHLRWRSTSTCAENVLHCWTRQHRTYILYTAPPCPIRLRRRAQLRFDGKHYPQIKPRGTGRQCGGSGIAFFDIFVSVDGAFRSLLQRSPLIVRCTPAVRHIMLYPWLPTARISISAGSTCRKQW